MLSRIKLTILLLISLSILALYYSFGFALEQVLATNLGVTNTVGSSKQIDFPVTGTGFQNIRVEWDWSDGTGFVGSNDVFNLRVDGTTVFGGNSGATYPSNGHKSFVIGSNMNCTITFYVKSGPIHAPQIISNIVVYGTTTAPPVVPNTPTPTPTPTSGPTNSLPAVPNITINPSGMASWSDIANEVGYSIQLYRNGIPLGATQTLPANTTSYDCAPLMIDPYFGVYTVVVTALADNVNFTDGPPTLSPPLTIQPALVPPGNTTVDVAGKTITTKDTTGAEELVVPGDACTAAIQNGYDLIVENNIARIRIPFAVVDKTYQLTPGQHLYVRMAKAIDPSIITMIKNSDPAIIDIKAFVHFETGVVSGVLLPRRLYNFFSPLAIDIKNVTNIQSFHRAAVYHVVPHYANDATLTDVDVTYSGGKAFPAKNEIRFYTDHFSYYIVMERKQTFEDIKSSWAQGAIELLAARKIITGFNSLFSPKTIMKRVDFSIVISKSLGHKPEVFSAVFTDIAPTDYFGGHILSLSKYTILDTNAGTIQSPMQFGVYENGSTVYRSVTREQAATFIMNAYKYVKGYKDYLPAIIGPAADYADLGSASSVIMRKNIVDIGKLGIMKGYPDGTFGPQKVLTREETAQLMALFLTKIDEISRFWDYAPDVT